MNTRNKRSFLIMPLVVVILAMTAISSAYAAGTRPFKGSFHATEVSTPGFPIVNAVGTGSGHATHLGRYTVSYTVAINVSTGAGTSQAVFVAANGDTVSAQGQGQFTPTGPGVGSIVETYSITGGSGRFAGASGSFILNRTLNQTTGVTVGRFEGQIVLSREFKGSFHATEVSTPGFPMVNAVGTGSGHATHLGRYTVSYTVAINVSTGAGTSQAVFVAANGDTVSAQGQGQFTPTGPGVGSIVETYSITGGSGRFAGASGSFILNRTLNQTTGVTVGAFDGHIGLPAGAS